MTIAAGWLLRRGVEEDIDELHALMCHPQVSRYLLDGKAPRRHIIAQWIETEQGEPADSGFGLWILCNTTDTPALAGCVRLVPYQQPGAAELVYALHPQYWGQGLATRMAWSIIQQALQGGYFTHVVAGADRPNTASFAVMDRLGMRFLRNVDYPLGPGREYVFGRGDAPPDPLPKPIAVV